MTTRNVMELAIKLKLRAFVDSLSILQERTI
jgi:hypothetical protein